MKKVVNLICIYLFIACACSSGSFGGVDKKFDQEIRKNIELSLASEPEFAKGMLVFDSPGKIVTLKNETKEIWTGVRTAHYFAGYLPVKIHVKKDIKIDSFLYRAGTVMKGKIFFQTVLHVINNNNQPQLSTHFHKTIAVTVEGPSRDKEKEKKFMKMLKETEIL